MFAIVCDKCGHTALLEEKAGRRAAYVETGFRKVCVEDPFESELDLCRGCFKDLLGAVRGKEGDNASEVIGNINDNPELLEGGTAND